MVFNREIENDPTNIGYRTDIVFAYSIVYDSGLVPDNVLKIYLSHALNHATVSLQLNPEQPDMLIHIGKILLQLGQYDKARHAFAKAVEINPSDTTYRFWKAEALYYLNDFAAVKKECKIISKSGTVAPKITPNIEYWSRHGA